MRRKKDQRPSSPRTCIRSCDKFSGRTVGQPNRPILWVRLLFDIRYSNNIRRIFYSNIDFRDFDIREYYSNIFEYLFLRPRKVFHKSFTLYDVEGGGGPFSVLVLQRVINTIHFIIKHLQCFINTVHFIMKHDRNYSQS